MSHLLIVTDAWEPQVNGVVRTLRTTMEHLERRGWTVTRLSPEQFASLPCPGYAGIRLALPLGFAKAFDAAGPYDAIHIATEGPLGLAARLLCQRRGLPFTTAYHTDFPSYLRAHFRVPQGLTYRFMRWFHDAAAAVMVATPSLDRTLRERGFTNTVRWSRGVDTTLFRRREPDEATGHWWDGPVWLNVGRVSPEKNLRAFLDLDLEGTKVVVGDGPELPRLFAEYPDVVFTGALHGQALAKVYSRADVFVFPSRTDTFGLVMAEAIASGVPVAAFPVTGPLDVVQHGVDGYLHEYLDIACEAALRIDPSKMTNRFTWEAATDQFVANLALTGEMP